MRKIVICLALSAAILSPLRAAEGEAAMRDAAFEGAQWIMFTAAARAVAGVGTARGGGG